MKSSTTSLTALLLAASLSASPAAAQTALSRTDSLLLTIAGAVHRGAADANESWLTQWFRGEFMLLRPEGGALAVFAGSPPPSLGLPASTHELGDSKFAHFFAPGTPGIPTRFDMPMIDRRRIVAFPLTDSIYSISDPVLATVVAVYHEAFHLHQLDTRWPRVATLTEVPPALMLTAEFQELAGRERALLARALYQSNRDSVRATLRTYLDTRAARMALLPPEHRSAEADDERVEASAQLVGYRAGLLAVEGTASDMVALISSDLRNTPPFDDPTRTSGSLRHWHIYATGSAIGMLLDRLGVTWKRELERGDSFVDVLTRAVRR
jgi:hypothetical protein